MKQHANWFLEVQPSKVFSAAYRNKKVSGFSCREGDA